MSFDFKIKNNASEMKNASARQIKNALWSMGATAEGYAKAGCPVDTGRLRNSITHDEGEDYTEIGTNVEYAEAVEEGEYQKHTVGAAHFLRNAISDHSDEYQQLFESALKS